MSRSLSVILTLHDRPFETVLAVLSSLEQGQDETVIVLDRTPAALAEYVVDICTSRKGSFGRLKLERIEGAPGWRTPMAAWNRAIAAAEGDLLYHLSSDTVQAPGNIDRARHILADATAAVFGKVVESDQERARKDPLTRPVLCSTDEPRPLGFVMALPRWAMLRAGCYDEAFALGQAHEDLDLAWRLWDIGLHFVFFDEMSGVHLTHDRPHVDQVLMEVNRKILVAKWGTSSREWAPGARIVRVWKDLVMWKNPGNARLTQEAVA